uniref:Uncharacterized protein n=1 Tax=Arundo donax TaxID=35708 RepID=A0A0A9DCI1_ARUDO
MLVHFLFCMLKQCWSIFCIPCGYLLQNDVYCNSIVEFEISLLLLLLSCN